MLFNAERDGEEQLQAMVKAAAEASDMGVECVDRDDIKVSSRPGVNTAAGLVGRA